MKVIYFVCALALTCMFSCNKVKETKAADTQTSTTVEVQAPATKVVVEKEKETSIKIGPEGGSIKTKNVEVEIDN